VAMYGGKGAGRIGKTWKEAKREAANRIRW
jgi:hypothetical protein